MWYHIYCDFVSVAWNCGLRFHACHVENICGKSHEMPLTPSMLSRKGHLRSTFFIYMSVLDPWRWWQNEITFKARIRGNIIEEFFWLRGSFYPNFYCNQSFCWANLILFYLLLWVPLSSHGQHPGCSLVTVPGSCHNASLHNVGAVLPNLQFFNSRVSVSSKLEITSGSFIHSANVYQTPGPFQLLRYSGKQNL